MRPYVDASAFLKRLSGWALRIRVELSVCSVKYDLVTMVYPHSPGLSSEKNLFIAHLCRNVNTDTGASCTGPRRRSSFVSFADVVSWTGGRER